MRLRDTVLGSLLLACMLCAAPAGDEAPRSNAAVIALNKHRRVVAEADAAHRRALAAADKDLRAARAEALKRALKSHSLEEANRIDRVLKGGASRLVAEDAKGLSKLLVERKFIGYRLANHAVRAIELRADGSIGKGAGFEDRWRAAAGNVIVIGGNDFESECVRCDDGTFRGVFPTGESIILYPEPAQP